ncbi:MAG: hypothetical protein HYY06_10160 [Deltaproteobacteria bacterium]|nr:hypothetical protein [Deltaproteobacteria bacterium]
MRRRLLALRHLCSWMVLALLCSAAGCGDDSGGEGEGEGEPTSCTQPADCEPAEYCKSIEGSPGEGQCAPCAEDGCGDPCPEDNYRTCLDELTLLSCEGGADGKLVKRDCVLVGKVCGTATLGPPMCEDAP